MSKDRVRTSEKREPKKAALNLYNEVVDRAELRAVQLVNLKFDVKPAYFADTDGVSLSYKIEPKEYDFAEEKGLGFAEIAISVTGRQSKKVPLSCKAEYLVVYRNMKGCERDQVLAYLKRVSTFACYPYFRSLFASLDWAAGTRLPPLPVHREPIVPRKSVENDKESKSSKE